MKQKQVKFEVKAIDTDTGYFEGYANTFNFVDFAGDDTQKGAFLATIQRHKENNTMPAMLWQHKHDQPIGAWDEMYEDDHGLYVKGHFTLGVQQADEAYALMKDNAISGFSIGYSVVNETYDAKTGVNYLNEVNLLETSIVTFPCNDQSRVTVVKSLIDNNEVPTEREMEKALRELGLSRKQSKSFLADGYKSFLPQETPTETSIPAELNNIVETKAAEELLNLLRNINK
ncbi:phage prohead protease [Moritella viscosa]|nr:HK97 family phage prohead protease [Moritella viscosa]CED59844.1 phage prohead protease [Moritella viscosa]SHO03539.1 Prohead protease [Moritella viscosa]